MKARSELQHIEKSRQLGIANRDIIPKARSWCTHLTIEMESSGMLAGMTGLPIGSHRVECRHSPEITGGMNLPWVLPRFVATYCDGCPHHSKGSDTTWGEGVIRQAQEAKAAEANRRANATARLSELRTRMLSLPRTGKSDADITEHAILEWIELLFEEDDAKAASARGKLQEAALVAHELFGDTAVNALMEGASAAPFDVQCLPVLGFLAGSRPDLDQRLALAAREALFERGCIEPACQILVETFARSADPVDKECVGRVIALRNHVLQIGESSERDYSASTRFLELAFDRDPMAVLSPLRVGLSDNDKYRRINACGVVKTLIRSRPNLGFELIHDIVNSLRLDDDMYGDSADAAACKLLSKLFRHSPSAVDDLLATRVLNESEEELQALYIDVYRLATQSRYRWANGQREVLDVSDQDLDAIKIAFQRALAFIQDSRLGVEARCEVPKAIESVCEDHPELAIKEFDLLLGTLALLLTQENPPPPTPRLILPGEMPPDPRLAPIEAQTRKQRWNQFRHSIQECLKELVINRPGETLPTLISSFCSLDSKASSSFKASVLRLIGHAAGTHPDHRVQVLPVLWKGLTDYDSQLVRASAIDALAETFGRGHAGPPSDVVDFLLVHLRDQFVIVHSAAIRAIESNTSWLDDKQAAEAVELLHGWAVTYSKNNPFQMRDVVRTMLWLSERLPDMRMPVTKAVLALLPTSEPLADQALTELLVQSIDSTEPAAASVAIQIARWIVRSERNTFDYHGDQSRAERFNWMYGMHPSQFAMIEQALLELAREAASDDPRDACLFAGLFAAFGRYSAESEVLLLAAAALPSGLQNDRFKKALETLHTGSEYNRRLVEQ